jgi:DNA-binding XRE family transcriptional regulator
VHASGGVPTNQREHVRFENGGHGAKRAIAHPTKCTLKAAASNPSIGMIASVKRTHKGPLRDVLARNMRKLRAARGLTQEALAHESGVNRTYLSSVERAERNVSIDNVARIAKALAVEPWKLLKDG